MKINIKQEGGFIGMASKAKLDFSKLTEDEQKMIDAIAQKEVEKAVELAAAEAAKAEATKLLETKLSETEAGQEMPKTIETPADAPTVAPSIRDMSPARDTFCYSLSMKKDGKKLDVAFDDTNAPPELVELFQKYIKI
jgi:hypothetical protein